MAYINLETMWCTTLNSPLGILHDRCETLKKTVEQKMYFKEVEDLLDDPQKFIDMIDNLILRARELQVFTEGMIKKMVGVWTPK